jgi:hypothetical protein
VKSLLVEQAFFRWYKAYFDVKNKDWRGESRAYCRDMQLEVPREI